MTTSWRVAYSLDQLLAQINAAHPNRSKIADGSIGDAAHAATKSDHNPDALGIVRARDYTHDPDGGFDAHAMADQLVASRDPRIAYVISRGRIASSTVAPWSWRSYSGSNPHNHHAHVSVVGNRLADRVDPWQIEQGEDEMTPKEVEQAVTNALSNYRLTDPDVKDGWISLPSFIRNRVARRADVGFARDQLLAAVKAGQSAGPDADADAIVDAIAERIAQ